MNKFAIGVSDWEIEFSNVTIKIKTVIRESIIMRANGNYTIDLKFVDNKYNDGIVELIKSQITKIKRSFYTVDALGNKKENEQYFLPDSTSATYIERLKMDEIGNYNLIIKNRG